GTTRPYRLRPSCLRSRLPCLRSRHSRCCRLHPGRKPPAPPRRDKKRGRGSTLLTDGGGTSLFGIPAPPQPDPFRSPEPEHGRLISDGQVPHAPTGSGDDVRRRQCSHKVTAPSEAGQGLNLRPGPCKDPALPLSYPPGLLLRRDDSARGGRVE